MTTESTTLPADTQLTGVSRTALLFLGAIGMGSVLGLADADLGTAIAAPVDYTIIAMIFLLFFELRFGNFIAALGNIRFLALAWTANFLVVPPIGFLIAYLLLQDQPLVFAGLLIYFLAPCTDWFLGFTRMARGDTGLGAALIPVNLITQLMLFPLWLWLFARHSGAVDLAAVPGLLVQWFLFPLLAAQALRYALQKLAPANLFERLIAFASLALPPPIALLIFQIFAGNIGAIVANGAMFMPLLAAVFLFFVATFIASEGLSRAAQLDYPQHALLTTTMAARNAPMMLAVTAVAVPDQPLILLPLVIGMLIEIPHLTALKQVLLQQRAKRQNAVS